MKKFLIIFYSVWAIAGVLMIALIIIVSLKMRGAHYLGDVPANVVYDQAGRENDQANVGRFLEYSGVSHTIL